MHILFVTDNFPPEVNAPASRTYEHAALWVAAGHRVSILTCAPNFPHGKLFSGYRNRWFQQEAMAVAGGQIDVYRVWSFMAPNAGVAKRMLDFASFMATALLNGWRIPRPDVVAATTPQLLAAFAGYGIARYRRVPFLCEVRDIWPDLLVDLGISRNGLMIRCLKRLARHVYQHADHVVTVGEGYSRDLHERYQVPLSCITALPNGILPELFSPQGVREATRQSMGWDGKTIAIYLGTHGYAQGLGTVLEAAKLLEDDPSIHIAFIGEGADKPAIMAEATTMGLGNVSFHPQQPKERVPALYEGADMCLVPLKGGGVFSGTYPSKIFEAMAMQCPILLSVEGMAAELIAESGGGLALPPESPQKLADAIRQLATSPEKRAEMGKKGRAFVLAHYARKTIAENYARLFSTIIRTKN